MGNTEPVSLNALAKILGRSKSGLHYLEKAGHIRRNSFGKFDITEVQRAIAENVDATMANRRKPGRGSGVRTTVRTPATACSNTTDMVLVDDKLVTIEQAEAERDRCLAALAELRNGAGSQTR